MAAISPAVAQNATVDTNAASLLSTVTAQVAVGDSFPQGNTGTIGATVDESNIAVTIVGSNNGLFLNSNNLADANAFANRSGAAVSLATIGSTATVSDGIGITAVQENTGAITSTATDQNLGIASTTFTAGSVDVSSNTVAANTTINEGSSGYAITVSGAEPVGYTNVADQNASVDADLSGGSSQVSTSTATVVVSSVQVTAGADSTAVAGGTSPNDNNITLDLLSSATSSLTGSATVDSNTVAATFKGNARTASIALNSADSSIAGTAAISNAQSYDGNTTLDNAQNLNTEVSADITGNSPTTYVNAFAGSTLSVADNTVSSAATGNTTTGSVTIADAQSFVGYANTATAYVGQDDAAALTGSVVDVAADASIVLGSTQLSANGGTAAFVNATTSGATVRADVQESTNSAIDLSTNTVSAAATANSLTNSVSSGTGSALFDGSVALASQQKSVNVDTNATASNNAISVTAGNTTLGTVADGSVTLDKNVTAAGATGNSASQSISLSAVTLDLGTSAVELKADGAPTSTHPTTSDVVEQYASAAGAVVAASVQLNATGSSVNASNTDSTITLTSNDDDGVSANMSFAVTDSTQQAYAQGSTATNSVDLQGTTVGSEAGVLSYQQNDAGSTVTATNTGKASILITENLGDGQLLIGSSATLTGNDQQAIAIGGNVKNTLTVDAGSIAVASNENLGTNVSASSVTRNALATDSVVWDNGANLPTVNAAYGTLNDQTILADVSATANASSGAAFTVQTGDSVNYSSVTNDANTVLAQGQGAVASNAIDLTIGSLSVTGATTFAGVGSVLNVQAIGDTADVTATAQPNGAAVVLTDIGNSTSDNVVSSSITTSGNTVSAIADGAKATNALTAGGTTLSAYDGSGGTAGSNVISATGSTLDAAFAVSNAQSGGTGTVSATLRQTATSSVTDSALVLTDVAGDVTDSSVASNGNLLRALADSNEAANALTLSATSLQTTAALANAQFSGSDVVSTIGYDGTAPTPATSPVNRTGSGSSTVGSYGLAGSTLTNTSGSSQTFTFGNTFQANDVAYLTSLGFSGVTLGGNSATLTNASSVDVSNFGSFSITGTGTSQTVTFNGYTIPGSAGSSGTPNAGGVIIAVGDDISSSTLAADGNTVQGSAIGNIGTNTLSVSATSIVGDGAQAVADSAQNGSESTALADYTVNNVQQVLAGSSSDTTVFATFAIDQAADQTITDSALSVSGNIQYGEALANTATNTLTVSGTDLDATTGTSAALRSVQTGTSASVDASSDMEVFANAASSGSSIALDRNSNTALGVINNAANTLTATATNFTDAAVEASAGAVVGDDYGIAAFTLNNIQSASGTLDTNASSQVYNNDVVDTDTAGVLNGSVSISSNTTRAESSANRATNGVTVDGSASLGATASLVNRQDTSTTVNATATSTVQFGLYGGAANEAINASTVTLEGNGTTAVARGNTASNAMTFTAGANYSTPTASPANLAYPNADGASVVLNDQNNTGAVTATATNVTYSVALNSAGGGAALNATVSNSNNAVSALAYGNSVSNTVTLAALNTGSPTVGVANQQGNSGNVTATASAVSYTTTASGTVGASTFRNSGNQISATAAGNSAFTTIGAR
ncbi:hypothetical protein [Novosphingobium sp.]|uniref:beta strand repeat-containing protein n=1 Tax=Novosphingobium sp. TaxID=1874826 RepID=UPI00260DB8AB|nr:hypothetical protein [Novosphingobium sp.]